MDVYIQFDTLKRDGTVIRGGIFGLQKTVFSTRES